LRALLAIRLALDRAGSLVSPPTLKSGFEELHKKSMSALQGQSLKSLILAAWQTTCIHIANSYKQQFVGQDKETEVLRWLRRELADNYPSLQFAGPDNQIQFEQCKIDLVCIYGNEKIAIECKYKIESDSAVPDNRKAAFSDLYKLENCVNSGNYSRGLFLWLTNEPDYLSEATGDSTNFSTHQGCVYQPNTPLTANRARGKMPLPLVLNGQYVFTWQQVLPNTNWHMLTLEVQEKESST